MEKRINLIAQNYVSKLKSDTMKYAKSLSVDRDEKVDAILQFVCDYGRLVVAPEDFAKRQRIRHVVSPELRCNGKRGAGNQCTRRKQEGKEYCGTHAKICHEVTTVLESSSSASSLTETLEVWTEEINGILYYVDKTGLIYDASDIVCNKPSPTVLGRQMKQTGLVTWL